MRRVVELTLLAGAASIGACGVAAAETELSANVTLTSNYVYRGLTQTDEGFAVQGGLDLTNDNFYAGVWASNVDDWGLDASAEVDLYVGVTPTLGPVEFDISLLGYFYPGTSESIDFAELMVAGAYLIDDHWTVGAGAYASNDYGGAGEDSLYLEANAAYALTETFALSGAFGNQSFNSAEDYDTWNVGATLTLHGFALDLRYHDLDLDGYDQQISFSISREF